MLIRLQLYLDRDDLWRQNNNYLQRTRNDEESRDHVAESAQPGSQAPQQLSSGDGVLLPTHSTTETVVEADEPRQLEAEAERDGTQGYTPAELAHLEAYAQDLARYGRVRDRMNVFVRRQLVRAAMNELSAVDYAVLGVYIGIDNLSAMVGLMRISMSGDESHLGDSS